MNPSLQAPRSILDLLTGTSVYNAPAKAPAQIQTQKTREAIAHNETRGVQGDPYAFSRPSGSTTAGNALGKYQVTEGLLKQLGPKYLGQQVTPAQFLSNPAYQDNFMNARIANFSGQGYTPQQIADMHRGGAGNYPFAPGATTYRNQAYVNAFNSAYQGTPRTVADLTK